jgi:restriction endonuclease S subunit
MNHLLATVAKVHTAVVFRDQAPQDGAEGNVRALAIRDLVAGKPLRWHELPRLHMPERYLSHCLQRGDVVIPSRGDYYRAWLFEGADDPVFPVGQLSVIRPTFQLDARYLVWLLNEPSTQKQISLLLTGTTIKALTKAALLSLEVEVPPMPKQQQIAELDQTTQEIVAIRHRLNEIDQTEIAHVTRQALRSGATHA